MKFNMETAFVQTAPVTECKAMMQEWKHTTALAKRWSAVVLIIELGIVFSVRGEVKLLLLPSALMFLLTVILLGKHKKIIYLLNSLSPFLIALAFFAEPSDLLSEAPKFSTDSFAAMFESVSLPVLKERIVLCALLLISVIPLYFSCKCILNYDSVYIPLTKRKGFPEFIFNTSDLYSGKMFIADEKKKAADVHDEPSFDSFADEKEKDAERLRRSQQNVALLPRNVREINFEADGVSKPKEKTAYKYGVSVFGRELVFMHNDIHESSFFEKKELMGKWNQAREPIKNNFFIKLFLQMAFPLLLLFVIGTGAALLYIPIFMYIFSVSGSERSRVSSFICLAVVPYIYLAAAIVFMRDTSFQAAMAVMIFLAEYAVTAADSFRAIHCLINRGIYKELSFEEGFPSFIRTTADLYADKMYITEKNAAYFEKQFKKPQKIMNIGYGEKEEKENKAWNAFNYKDEKDDEDENGN